MIRNIINIIPPAAKLGEMVADVVSVVAGLDSAHIPDIQMAGNASCWRSPWTQQIVVLERMNVHYSSTALH
jgi:hypothetical protein